MKKKIMFFNFAPFMVTRDFKKNYKFEKIIVNLIKKLLKRYIRKMHLHLKEIIIINGFEILNLTILLYHRKTICQVPAILSCTLNIMILIYIIVPFYSSFLATTFLFIPFSCTIPFFIFKQINSTLPQILPLSIFLLNFFASIS